MSHVCGWVKTDGVQCTRTCRIENANCAKHRERPAPKQALPCGGCLRMTKTRYSDDGGPMCPRPGCGVNMYRRMLRARKKAAKAPPQPPHPPPPVAAPEMTLGQFIRRLADLEVEGLTPLAAAEVDALFNPKPAE